MAQASAARTLVSRSTYPSMLSRVTNSLEPILTRAVESLIPALGLG
jgi:hypothetical protein